MISIPAGVAHSITMPFQDAGGTAVVPSALAYRILDENDVEVKASAALSLPGSGSTVVVPVTPGYNMLDAGVISVMRIIELTMTTASGPVILTSNYLVTAAAPLSLLVNSFQTVNQARVIASEIPNLARVPSVSDQELVPALMLAFQRMIRFGYEIQWPIDYDAQNILVDDITEWRHITPRMWPLMTADRWTTWYPPHFRRLMNFAQVAEADAILQSSASAMKRASGIVSETVGESSITYRDSKALDIGLSTQALAYLEGFIHIRMVITRA